MAHREPISPVTTSKPELTLSAASINPEPVELDGTPTSPEKVKEQRNHSKQDESGAKGEERRAQLISERQDDKGVLVDIPKTPSSEEFARSKDPEAKTSDVSRA